MSLINEALKKAQRLRTEDPAGSAPPIPGGGIPVAKRAQPRSTQQLVVLGVGGIVLVVLSVVVTVWLVNRPSAVPPASPVAAHPAPKTAQDSTAPAPVIVPPVIAPAPVADAPPKPAAPPPAVAANATPVVPVPAPAIVKAAPPALPIAAAVHAPAPTPAPPPAPTPSPATAATDSSPPPTAAAPAPTPPPAEPVKSDERVHAFVDAIHVTGIRSSGSDSRVLMNDRVFRVNDIVERNLGLRLTKVESGSLTFTDANGATYVKNF